MGTPVTDPKLLAVLNSEGTPSSGKGQPVTDPKLLAVLNGDALPELPAPNGVKPRPAGGSGDQSALSQGLHGLGLAANSILKGAGAAPAYLMDMATSPLRDTNGGIGRDIAQLGYTVQKPSQLWQEGIDKLIPSQPQNPGEQIANVVGQMGGGMLGPVIGRQAEPPSAASSQLRQNLQTAGQTGVRVTPGEAQAGPMARMVEGVGGKGKLALKNQVMNQGAIDKLMKAEFGLPQDTQFTPDTFKTLEQQAINTGYKPIENYDSYVRFGPEFRNKLADISQQFGTTNSSFPGASSGAVEDMVHSYQGTGAVSGKDAINAIRQLRQGATAAYNSGNPTYNPSLGNAKIAVANAIEDQLGTSLAANPDTAGLVPAFQDARTTLAKLKAAQDAFMPASGQWNAAALTNKLNNGAPLTGNLKAIAQMAGSFKKSMRMPVQGMPPAVSGTKILGVPAAVAGSLMAGHPMGAAVGLGMLAPDAARGLATSSLFQNNMVNGTGALSGAMGQIPTGAMLPALMQMLQQQSVFSPRKKEGKYPPLQPMPQQ